MESDKPEENPYLELIRLLEESDEEKEGGQKSQLALQLLPQKRLFARTKKVKFELEKSSEEAKKDQVGLWPQNKGAGSFFQPTPEENKDVYEHDQDEEMDQEELIDINQHIFQAMSDEKQRSAREWKQHMMQEQFFNKVDLREGNQNPRWKLSDSEEDDVELRGLEDGHEQFKPEK